MYLRQKINVAFKIIIYMYENVIILTQQDAFKYNIKTVSSHSVKPPKQWRRWGTIVVGFTLLYASCRDFCGWNESVDGLFFFFFVVHFVVFSVSKLHSVRW